MKCINCGRDSKLKERTANNGCCYYCGHQFAFEKKVPTENAKFTYLFFANVLNSISAQKTLFFTSKKLGYFLDKRLKPAGPYSSAAPPDSIGWPCGPRRWAFGVAPPITALKS